MNIHEYQGKAVLKSFGAPVAEGIAVFTADEARAAAEKLPGPLYVVKTQIHAGGRGKGTFKELPEGSKGGVRLAHSPDEVFAHAAEMLGNTLETKQTGEGRQAGQPAVYRGWRGHRSRALSARCWLNRTTGKHLPLSPRPKAAWTSRPWPKTRPRKFTDVADRP
jgi:hypothetical protein